MGPGAGGGVIPAGAEFDELGGVALDAAGVAVGVVEVAAAEVDPAVPGSGSVGAACTMSSVAMVWLGTGPAWLIATAPVLASPCIANRPPITATARRARAIRAQKVRQRKQTRAITPLTISAQPYGLATCGRPVYT